MVVASIKLDTRNLDRLMTDLRPRAEAILTSAAIDVQRRAILKTLRVDTGAMKAGWRWESSGTLRRVIYNTQEYALYHELGFHAHGTWVPAMPMLRPAVEEVRATIIQAWRRLFR